MYPSEFRKRCVRFHRADQCGERHARVCPSVSPSSRRPTTSSPSSSPTCRRPVETSPTKREACPADRASLGCHWNRSNFSSVLLPGMCKRMTELPPSEGTDLVSPALRQIAPPRADGRGGVPHVDGARGHGRPMPSSRPSTRRWRRSTRRLRGRSGRPRLRRGKTSWSGPSSPTPTPTKIPASASWPTISARGRRPNW